MPSPFTSALVRCRHPGGCAAVQLVASGPGDIDGQLSGIGWCQHHEHGWICPAHADPANAGDRLTTRLVLTERTRIMIQAIRDGHNFGMAIMRETGLSESTVYATLRRLQAAGWAVCEREPVEVAVRLQRPQRNIYRLADGLLDELGWPR